MSEPIERDAPQEPQVRPVRIVLGLLGAVVAGVVVFLIIGHVAGFSNLSDTFDGADERWLAVCAVGQVVVFAGYAGALRRAIAFEGGPRIGARPSESSWRASASLSCSRLVAPPGWP